MPNTSASPDEKFIKVESVKTSSSESEKSRKGKVQTISGIPGAAKSSQIADKSTIKEDESENSLTSESIKSSQNQPLKQNPLAEMMKTPQKKFEVNLENKIYENAN